MNENNVSILFPKNEISIVTIVLYIPKEHEHVAVVRNINSVVVNNSQTPIT